MKDVSLMSNVLTVVDEIEIDDYIPRKQTYGEMLEGVKID